MNTNEEDDEVVIKGSPLYEHLHKLGYNDFESVTIEKVATKSNENIYTQSGLLHSAKNLFKKLNSFYLKVIQDDVLSKKQVETILNAKILLNDHGCAIHSFLENYGSKPWRSTALRFILLGTVISSSMYISYNTHYKNSTSLFALTLLLSSTYVQYLRLHAHTDLKSVVSLQNDLFDLCKKGMKILKYGYKINFSKGKGSQAFSDLTSGRLKYLQPIIETLVKYLEHTLFMYYHASLILLNILPPSDCYNGLLTRFENISFRMHGEITYQKLKTLYHTYILTQSEMLHLLAIAYNNYTWQESHKKMPEFRLAHIVHFLMIHLTEHKKKLSEVISTYYKFKFEPIAYKYKGPNSSSWQDTYMQLYLASCKLQLSYSFVLSVLQDIDNGIIENTGNENCVENIMQKLSAAQKGIETAKDFIEFGSLLLVKTQMNDCIGNHLETNISTSAANTNVRIITDSEPEIMDEVFEEYIKEEYLKPLTEEASEISLYNCKRDKILLKNFMTELKDALVDKRKSMSERETKALERMYKTLTKNTILEDQQEIPKPPPMPPFNAPPLIQNSNINSNDTTNLQFDQLLTPLTVTKPVDNRANNFEQENLNDISREERVSRIIVSLPQNKELLPPLLPSFLKAEEETFTGSGENSEDDNVEDA